MHWGRRIAYPNGRFPAPTEDRMRAGVPSCLPQWEITCPDRPLPTPMRATAVLDLDVPPATGSECTVTSGFRAAGSELWRHGRLPRWVGAFRPVCLPYPPSPGRRRGPKCVWVSLFSEGPARGWSKMRLSSTDLAGSRRIRADSDAFWTTHPERPRIRPRLRRISDHAPGKIPDPPETQTYFGPPGRSQFLLWARSFLSAQP